MDVPYRVCVRIIRKTFFSSDRVLFFLSYLGLAVRRNKEECVATVLVVSGNVYILLQLRVRPNFSFRFVVPSVDTCWSRWSIDRDARVAGRGSREEKILNFLTFHEVSMWSAESK